MKKVLLLIFVSVLGVGCNSDDSDSSSSSIYNPPNWIHGNWGLRTNNGTGTTETPFYRFTNDNVCQLQSGISANCWKETINQFPQLFSGSDLSSDTSYTASLLSGNGSTSLTFTFQKVSTTKILWIVSSGNIELDKLD